MQTLRHRFMKKVFILEAFPEKWGSRVNGIREQWRVQCEDKPNGGDSGSTPQGNPWGSVVHTLGVFTVRCAGNPRYFYPRPCQPLVKNCPWEDPNVKRIQFSVPTSERSSWTLIPVLAVESRGTPGPTWWTVDTGPRTCGQRTDTIATILEVKSPFKFFQWA